MIGYHKSRYIDASESDSAFQSRKAIALHKVREFFRDNYRNGMSDESFIDWIRVELTEARDRSGNLFQEAK